MAAAHERYIFGPFLLDAAERRLERDGHAVALRPQPFNLLLVFLRHGSHLLTKEDLLREGWGETNVTESSLDFAISTLRSALGQTKGSSPHYIETVPRAGYRLGVPVRKPSHNKWRRLTGYAVLAAASVAFLISAFLTGRHSLPEPVVLPLTTLPGWEAMPSFSPDGTRVAFSWRGQRHDNLDVYVNTLNGTKLLRLTSDPHPDGMPAWSPDGLQIAFTRTVDNRRTILVIPALGGAERKLAEVAGPYIAWTPDGRSIVVMDRDAESEPYSLYRIVVDSGERIRLTFPPETAQGDYFPAPSPDGKSLAFQRRLNFDQSDIYLISAHGGNPARLTTIRKEIDGLAWTPDSREIVFSSNLSGSYKLWRLRMDLHGRYEPERVDYVDGDAWYPAIARAGPRRLAFERIVEDSNIWRMNLAGQAAAGPAAQLIASSRSEHAPQFSPDGRDIAFSSDRTGSFEIWTCDSQGSNLKQLTFIRDRYVGSPAWSPDGSQIAFDARPGGNPDIYVVSAAGGTPRRLMTDASREVRPSWSRDGRWIYFRSNRMRAGDQIWKISSEGGESVQVTKGGGYEAFESPDAKTLYFARAKTRGLWSIPSGGGPETPIAALQAVVPSHWSIAANAIYFVDNETGLVRRYDLTTKRVTVVGSAERAGIDGTASFAVAPDESVLLFVRIDHQESDLFLIENFR